MFLGPITIGRSLFHHCRNEVEGCHVWPVPLAPLKQYVVGPWTNCCRYSFDPCQKLHKGRSSRWKLVIASLNVVRFQAKSHNVAEKLISELIVVSVYPVKLHSDQGSSLNQAYCGGLQLLGIEKTPITPPNHHVERFNRSLTEILNWKIREVQTD